MSLAQWFVDYDYRRDDGPRRVGPFPTREAGVAWADAQNGPGWEAECSVLSLTPPEHAGRRT